MRTTIHNGKRGEGSAAHNARHYDTLNDAHIHSAENVYYQLMSTTSSTYSHSAPDIRMEKLFYRFYFSKYLDDHNERSIASGHKERVQTVNDYYAKHPPEEALIYFGNKDTAPSREEWIVLFEDYLQRYSKLYPHVPIINASIHFDEDGAPHAHVRRVYLDDTSSYVKYGAFKALYADGLTNTQNKRYNNNKRDFTAAERLLIQTVAKDHGYDIQTEPKPLSGLSLSQYQFLRDRDSIIRDFIEQEGLTDKFARFRRSHSSILLEKKKELSR